MKLWIKDPITKLPSVPLTLVVISVLLMISGIVMECFTQLRSTHLLDELFGAAMTLYGAHVYTFRDKIKDDCPPSEPITP